MKADNEVNNVVSEIDGIRDNLTRIRNGIEHAAQKAGRNPDEVTLVVVTKTFGLDTVRNAIEAGATDVGENYVQEARAKIQAVGREAARWHFIGGLQTNKAKYVVRLFDLVHSVDGYDLAAEIDRRAAIEGRVMDILIQVDISREAQKSGVMEEDLVEFVRTIAPMPHVAVKGLMGMPPFGREPEASRPYFRRMRELFDEIASLRIPAVDMKELSMGMSNDFEVAVEEGATMVRVGTAVFGQRG
ncbi:MAG: YggS family pyridoxal phosphate-dependent enzyme [Deltaproteobacteria bacterium]|nr:YggS family pyridoxal phosphate-dependent enzyme [Candidatus Zymogenaceae bacterium]